MTRGFTLIELLVVITIIVVLLVLLTPALDRAIYQAELVVCAAKLQSLATTANIYAMEYKRRYPYRGNLTETEVGANALGPLYKWRPTNLFRDTDYDLREVLGGYIGINATLLDPMVEQVDLEVQGVGTHIFTSYPLWFGWNYTFGGRALGGMKKIGDRFVWPSDPDSDGVPDNMSQRFSLLAADRDQPGTHGEISHPDRDGVATSESWENEDALSAGAPAGTLWTDSRWQVPEGMRPFPGRGAIDENFAYADGSVLRLNDIEQDEFNPNSPNYSGRIARVSMEADERVWPNEGWITVPRE